MAILISKVATLFLSKTIKGKHLGEFDIEGNITKPVGNHKLNIK